MKTSVKFKLIFMLIIFILFVLVYELFNKNILNNNTLHNSQTFSNLTNEYLYSFDKNVFAFNNSSLKFINQEKVVWEESLNFTNSYAVFSKNKIAIGDKSSNSIKIYSQSGHMYTVNSSTPINFFTINENGLLAIITKKNQYYEINIYNESGELKFGIKNIASSQGIPVSCTISPDNNTLAVNFLQIDGISPNSNISIYSLSTINNTSSAEDNYTNTNLFGAFLKEAQFVGILGFINNNTLISVSDKEVTIFKIKENVSSSSFKVISLNNKLKFFNILDDKSFVLVFGSPLNNGEESYDNNTLVFYNASGEKTGEMTFNQNIVSVSGSLGACIVQTNRLFTAVNKQGKILWEYQAIQDISQVIFHENTNKILVSSGSDVKEVKITKKLTEQTITDLQENNNEDEKDNIGNNINNDVESENSPNNKNNVNNDKIN